MPGFDYQKQAQDYYAQAPVIVLGSGASCAFGFPDMAALADHITTGIDTVAIPDGDTGDWSKFCGLLDTGMDLEAALHAVNFSAEMTDMIVLSAWEMINSHDAQVYKSSLSDRSFFPLGKLLSHMFRSSLNTIDLITTNYDCLIEYACDQEGLHFYSGFSHGITRKLLASDHVKCNRTVNIWKVHGSIDWFYGDNETVSMVRTQDRPDHFKPQIVTPGVSKYQRALSEPFRTIMGSADDAILKSNSYLCVGFGFNDEHIQPKLLTKCQQDNASITIVTYGLTEQAKELIFSGKISNFLAIERGENDNQSKIYSSKVDGEIIAEGDYWSLPGYMKLIM